MLPWSRGLRKEFLPLYERGVNGQPVLKPVANLAFETLVDAGCRDLVLVVGGHDGGTSVQSYFTIDREFLERHAHQSHRLADIAEVYRLLSNVRVRFAVQPEPAGFGDAVMKAQPYVGRRPFLLHAGDAVLLERHRGHLPSLLGQILEKEGLDAVLLARKVANPRNYGVIEGTAVGSVGPFRRLHVTGMEEKPEHPKTHWAATAIYAFTPRIFDALGEVGRGKNARELELTAGIQQMLRDGARIAALVLNPRYAEWRSVGSPEGYLKALRRTHTIASSGRAFGVTRSTAIRPGVSVSPESSPRAGLGAATQG